MRAGLQEINIDLNNVPKRVCMCVSVLVYVALLCISRYIGGLQDASCAHTHHLSG